MRFQEYISAQPTPTDPRGKRTRLSVSRSVTQLEGFLGKRLSLTASKWKSLTARLLTFTSTDWRHVREVGDAAVQELKKKQTKPSATKPTS